VLGFHQLDHWRDLDRHPAEQLGPENLVLEGVVMVQEAIDEVEMAVDDLGLGYLTGGTARTRGAAVAYSRRKALCKAFISIVATGPMADGTVVMVTLLWSGCCRWCLQAPARAAAVPATSPTHDPHTLSEGASAGDAV
jgi:hypothetical protein